MNSKLDVTSVRLNQFPIDKAYSYLDALKAEIATDNVLNLDVNEGWEYEITEAGNMVKIHTVTLRAVIVPENLTATAVPVL
jgi:hypothetical protein